MRLEYLRIFVSIVEHGSLSAAARAKRISQPAVTKQVQRIESEMGLTLLVRGSRRRLELTPAGERVLAFAYVLNRAASPNHLRGGYDGFRHDRQDSEGQALRRGTGTDPL